MGPVVWGKLSRCGALGSDLYELSRHYSHLSQAASTIGLPQSNIA